MTPPAIAKLHASGANPGNRRRRLRIGLVNSMPDGAVCATERQFRGLLQAALPDGELDLQLFELPGLIRSAAIRARMAGRYQSFEAIADAGLDALVVTGAKPGEGSLRNAAFWPGFTRLVDLALDLGLPAIWSCLAAHAAVDYLDGVERRPLPSKHSGVFPCAPVWSDPLLDGVDRVWSTPHSRFNDLAEADLVARGYDILTRSPTVGVDAFVKRGPPLFLFCQGHPEYDRDSLALEYRRDLHAFLQGERPAPPDIPAGLLDAGLQALWRERTETSIARGRIEPARQWPLAIKDSSGAAPWRAFAVGLYANWLRLAVDPVPGTFRPLATPLSSGGGLTA